MLCLPRIPRHQRSRTIRSRTALSRDSFFPSVPHLSSSVKTRFILMAGACVIAAALFTACETDEGRVRQGIHDPIERHKKHSWTWPFKKSRDSAPRPPRPTSGESDLPQYQPMDTVEPG
jgi:hypothetical protein